MKQLRTAGLIVSLGLLSTCAAAPSRVEATGERRWFPLTVAFGADENTLLMGTCPTEAEDRRDCRVEVLDLKANRSVAFTAPPGRFLQMPSMGADGRSILAVATAIAFDDTGNRPATIVRFDPKAPERAEVVLDSPTELLMPSETKWGFAAWVEKCETATQKYCSSNPYVRLPGQTTPLAFGRDYNFINVGPIFIRQVGVIAEAEYRPSFDLNAPSVIYVENRNNLWYLQNEGENSSKRITQAGLAGLTIFTGGSGDLFIIAENRDGIGIFRQREQAFVRVADYPKEADAEAVFSIAAVADGKKFAAVARYPREVADETKLIVADHLFNWKQAPLPRPMSSRTVSVLAKGV